MEKSIEIKGLTKAYKTRKAVDDVTYDIKEGELFALLGLNGAGKTTTIKMLCCLAKPTSGDAFVFGHSVLTDEHEVKKLINISPQETAVAGNLSIEENLEFIARIYGYTHEQAKEKAKEMMEKFRLTDRAKDKTKTLSGGLKRRLSIAMGLISDPKVFFLDEPTLGLDVKARKELWNIIEELKSKMTIILTTHYLEEVEALADRVGIMTNGRLVGLGTIEELKAKYNKEKFEDVFLELAEEVE